jgi:serine/threonine protein phosphatase PrpC
MANRKLRNFEYANHTEKGNQASINTDQVEFFDCSNGSVFVICQDGENVAHDVSLSSMAVQRMKYYFENEYVVNPVNALYNALIYTNGFIFEYARKNDNYQGSNVHCACVLVRDNKLYYAVLGELVIYYSNGKKLFLIARDNQETDRKQIAGMEDTEDNSSENGFLLGMARNVNPEINIEPLEPVNDDILLLCNKGLYEFVPEKSIQKILADPMPVQTKLYRLLDMANIAGGEKNISVQLVSFYNLDNTIRKFKPLASGRPGLLKKKPDIKTSEAKDDSGDTVANSAILDKYWVAPYKYVMIALIVLLVAYMFYDIFFKDQPKVVVNDKPRKETAEITEPASDSLKPVEELAEDEVVTVSVPDDRLYVVKSGDTWGNIYTEFGVCSWFIRNLDSNQGKFDSDDNPIAGSRIYIPLIYSSKQSLNPDFYQEFSLEKTGRRCENANEEFIQKFREANL